MKKLSKGIRVAKVSDLPPGECGFLDADGVPLAVFNVDGSFYAIDDACSHQGGPLSEGEIDGCVVALGTMETTTVAILIIGFLFLTAPVAAHMIGRAAHRQQIPKWKGTVVDESPLGESGVSADGDHESKPH